MKKEYQAFTIDKYDGKTYWHSKRGSEHEVMKHAKRYCQKSADLIIYDVSNSKIQFHKHIPSNQWQQEKSTSSYLDDPCNKGMKGENYHE